MGMVLVADEEMAYCSNHVFLGGHHHGVSTCLLHWVVITVTRTTCVLCRHGGAKAAGHHYTNTAEKTRLHYSGYVCRMDNSRYPTLVIYGYVHGHRGRGRPRKGGWTWYIRTGKLYGHDATGCYKPDTGGNL